MKRWRWTTVLVMALSFVWLAAPSVTAGEKEIPLAEVPEVVIQAAQGAVEGIELTEAEVEEEDGRVVYEIEGTADGKEYEIEVTADGEVLEVEADDDDEDEGEDDDADEKGDD